MVIFFGGFGLPGRVVTSSGMLQAEWPAGEMAWTRNSIREPGGKLSTTVDSPLPRYLVSHDEELRSAVFKRAQKANLLWENFELWKNFKSPQVYFRTTM